MSRTGVPLYKPAPPSLGSVKPAHCFRCGKLIYVYVEPGDSAEMKSFCGWSCSDAHDRRKR